MAGEIHDRSQFHRRSLVYQRAVTTFDHVGLDEAEAVAVLADVRSVQRALDGLLARVARRADELAAEGRSLPGAEMLRGAGVVSADQARTEARRAETTTVFPAAGDALDSGRTSGAHIDAIGSLIRDLTDEQVAAMDCAALVESACSVPVETFRRRWRREINNIVGDHSTGDAEAKKKACRLRMGFNHTTGMGWLNGELDPESFERLNNALEAQMNAICKRTEDSVSKDANLAARALVELVSGDGAKTGRPSISVVIDIETLVNGPHPASVVQTENGYDLAVEAVAKMLPTADLRRVVTCGSVPIDVGRRHRLATDAQWAAVKAVYSTCAIDGCDAPISHCQLHHIHEWEEGGPTDLDNLVPLCCKHHHLTHDHGWTVKLLPDRTLEVFKPDGTQHMTVDPPRRC